MTRYILSALLLAVATPASAQHLPASGHLTATGHLHDGSAYCGTDLSSPEARRHLEAFVQAQASGTLPHAASKSSAPPTLGDRMQFNVLEGAWGARQFEVVDITPRYYLWVEVAELPNLAPGKAESLRSAMLDETPEGSFRPSFGILENNLHLFGDMPNYDGDGMLDVLMYDIDPTGTTAGYVSSADLSPSADPGVGNQRDVLYLDSRLDSRWIAAHELTHLIHLTYGGDESFIMEGIAEYSMVANGYFYRSAGYVQSTTELERPLFSWGDGAGDIDYQRGSLFFSYVGERIGPEATGGIVQRKPGGPDAVNYVLTQAGLNLKDVIRDFHTANYINDRSFAPEFGYEHPSRALVQAARPTPIEGTSTSSTEVAQLSFEGGSVRYVRWRNVRNFGVQFDTPTQSDAARPLLRARIKGRLVVTALDGSRVWVDLAATDETTRLNGEFSQVLLLIANVSGTTSFSTSVDYAADWQQIVTGTADEPAADLPDRVALRAAYPNPFNPSTTLPFELPQSGTVRLLLVDALGRTVRTVLDGWLAAGTHVARVDAGGLPGGTYLLVMEAGGSRTSRAVTLLK